MHGCGEEEKKDGGVYTQRNFPFFREDIVFSIIIITDCNIYIMMITGIPLLTTENYVS